MRFVDTNVLLYSISTAGDEKEKAEISRGLLGQTDLALSVQVLQEFYVQATRPTKEDRISHAQATTLVEAWLRFRVREIDVVLMQSAFAAATRFRISYWDAAIIEAARSLDCPQVLSEDLNDGQDFGGLVVRNPFRGSS